MLQAHHFAGLQLKHILHDASQMSIPGLLKHSMPTLETTMDSALLSHQRGSHSDSCLVIGSENLVTFQHKGFKLNICFRG